MTKDGLEAFLCDYKLLCLKHNYAITADGWLEIADLTDVCLDITVENLRHSGHSLIRQQEEEEQMRRSVGVAECIYEQRQMEILKELVSKGIEVDDQYLTTKQILLKRKLLTQQKETE